MDGKQMKMEIKCDFILHFHPFFVHSIFYIAGIYKRLWNTSSRVQCRATNCRHQQTQRTSRILLDFNPLFTATVPAPTKRHHRVTVDHWCYDSNNGDNTLHTAGQRLITSKKPDVSQCIFPFTKKNRCKCILFIRLSTTSPSPGWQYLCYWT